MPASGWRSHGGNVIFAFAAPSRDGAPVAAVVHAGLLCMVEALSKAVPRRVAVQAVGGGGSAASVAVEIARGVRFIARPNRVSTAPCSTSPAPPIGVDFDCPVGSLCSVHSGEESANW